MRYLQGLLFGAIMIWGCMLTTATKVEAEAVTEYTSSEGWKYVVLEDSTVKITGYKDGNIPFDAEGEASVTIPAELDDNTVTVLGEALFENCSTIKTVVLSEGIKEIEDKCFYQCSNLETMTLPKSLEIIGEEAFYGCINWDGFYSRSVLTRSETNITFIGAKAFWYTGILDSLRAGNKIITIISHDVGESDEDTTSPTWYDPVVVGSILLDGRLWYEGSEEITISSGTEMVCSYAFYSPVNVDAEGPTPNPYITTVTFEDPDTKLEKASFYGMSNLESVTLPENLTRIESQTFEGCSGLTSIDIPDSVTYIGADAFKGCSSLEEVVLPSALETLDENAFDISSDESDTNLQITIPEDLENVSGLQGLQYINNIQYITINVAAGSQAYFYLTDNETVQFNIHTYLVQSGSSDGENGSDSGNGAGQGNSDSGNGAGEQGNSGSQNGTNNGTNGTQENGNQTTNGTQTAGNETQTSADSNNTAAQPVIGKIYTVKTLKYKVESGKKVTCMGPSKKTVKKVIIPATVEILGQVFKVTAVGKGAMKGCKNLTTVEVGNNVQSIKDKAFMNCEKLQKITVGKNVKTIGKRAYQTVETCKFSRQKYIHCGRWKTPADFHPADYVHRKQQPENTSSYSFRDI